MLRSATILPLFLTLSTAGLGCHANTHVAADDSTIPALPPYDGPKASIMIRGFDWPNTVGRTSNLTVSSSAGVLSGLEAALKSALFNSNRFHVVERADFERIRDEEALKEEGWTKNKSGPERGHVIAADIAIRGTVVEWNIESGGQQLAGSLLMSFLSQWFGWIGQMLGAHSNIGSEKGVCVINLELIDMQTSRMFANETVRGEASSFRVGVGGLAGAGGIMLTGDLSQYENTPMGLAVRKAVADAVRRVVERLPSEYYRHAPEPPPFSPSSTDDPSSDHASNHGQQNPAGS